MSTKITSLDCFMRDIIENGTIYIHYRRKDDDKMITYYDDQHLFCKSEFADEIHGYYDRLRYFSDDILIYLKSIVIIFNKLKDDSMVNYSAIKNISLKYRANITSLLLTNNNIKQLYDFKCFSNLINLDCSCNMIISLDELCFCTNLEELDCSNNNLTKLDITHNKNIKIIICHYNKLNKINISNNIKLDMLECSNNNLTHIDNLETCINLRELYASDNKIISMKTPPKISRIVCSNNALTTFEVKSKELKYLNCNKNQINDLYLASEKLEELCCRFNKLKYINVSKFVNLTQFDCDNNPLDELPNITNLAKLMCFFHPPSVFHISLSQEDMENMRCDYMANNNYIYKVKKYQITFFNKN